MIFKNTWQFEHEPLELDVLHPTEDIHNSSKVLNINNKILHDIDMSYDSNPEPVPPLLDNDNIESNQLRELQLKQLL
jgi:hypothetical protein